jgi:hypothetical protein
MMIHEPTPKEMTTQHTILWLKTGTSYMLDKDDACDAEFVKFCSARDQGLKVTKEGTSIFPRSPSSGVSQFKCG